MPEQNPYDKLIQADLYYAWAAGEAAATARIVKLLRTTGSSYYPEGGGPRQPTLREVMYRAMLAQLGEFGEADYFMVHAMADAAADLIERRFLTSEGEDDGR